MTHFPRHPAPILHLAALGLAAVLVAALSLLPPTQAEAHGLLDSGAAALTHASIGAESDTGVDITPAESVGAHGV